MISKRPNPTSPKSINNPSSIHHQAIINPSNIQPKTPPKSGLLASASSLAMRSIYFCASSQNSWVRWKVRRMAWLQGSIRQNLGINDFWGSKCHPNFIICPCLCLSIFINVSMFINIYRYLSIFIDIYQWLSMVINVYKCLSFISVLQQSKIISRTPWLMLFLDSSSDS